jgi:hypothetical protein
MVNLDFFDSLHRGVDNLGFLIGATNGSSIKFQAQLLTYKM